MSQQEFLTNALRLLNTHGVPYMLTGSVVSSIQGEPRLTHDIDIIIHCGNKILKILHENFDPTAYYFDNDAVAEAVAAGGMFNLIEIETGDKIDFWLLTESAFDESRFTRKIQITIFDETAWISTPEDTILAKLLCGKKSGGSEKQFRDALGVYETNRQTLDRVYLDRWSLRLGIAEYLQTLVKKSSQNLG